MSHFKLSPEDIEKGIDTVKDNIKYPTIIENIQEVLNTGEILEKEIQTADGKWYQMNILPYKVQKENRTNGVIITFVDITQRIAVLRDLDKLTAKHDTLVYALSHDIKQPLTTLSLLESVLEHAFDKQDKALFQRYLARLRGSVNMVNAQVNGFITANVPEPEWEKKLERINIEATVDDITTALKTENFTRENFETDFPISEIFFSRNNFRSIVFNLLNNAINYKDPQRDLKVRISSKKIDGFVVLQVQDNGIGIAQEHQEKIFGKGQRINSHSEGTGMGLYIIKRMLESMGSRIILESNPGEGSTFSVYFKEKAGGKAG